MARTTGSKTETVITSDIVRAFAEALDNGFTGSLNEFADSDAGKAAVIAFQDQRNAELRSSRMADSKAIWRDLKAFGTIASPKGIEAAKSELRFLTGLDLDNLEATEESPVSTRKRTKKDADATDGDGAADDSDADDSDDE